MDDPNREFLRYVEHIHIGYGENINCRNAYIMPIDYVYKYEGEVYSDIRTLDCLIYWAKRFGVEIDEAVIKRFEEMQKAFAEFEAERQAKREAVEREERWNRVCKHGCGTCNNLGYYTDIPICKVTGEQLREENRPAYDGVVHKMFNYLPFPSDNCPYNPNK